MFQAKAELPKMLVIRPGAPKMQSFHDRKTDSIYERIGLVFVLKNDLSATTLIDFRCASDTRSAGIYTC